ncbi:MAG: ABC transporter ATP-binding protein [Azospirillaceae bacterium]|nr:ABC transporter ATP-binding protein [Azospirillaceae bacterium]
MIRFENVSKWYPGGVADAVDNLSLFINEGEICVLVGSSGCGKTTTMKMINKLIEPSSGTIYLDGQNIETLDTLTLRLNIGYIIQEIGLFPHMTVAENVATIPVELGWKPLRIKARVEELLDLVDLDPRLFGRKKPRELNASQKLRVGIARALAANPMIMLMDEPFGALDPVARTRMQDEFLTIHQKIHKTIVLVTHDIDEAIRMGDRIAVMRNGRVLQFDTPREILSHPADPFVSELIGDRKALKLMNLISCAQLMHDVSEFRQTWNRDFKAGGTLPGASTIGMQATAQDALAEMFRTGERFLFVEDDSHQVQGVIELDDLFKSVSQGDDARKQ